MASWNQNPEWTNTSDINKGNRYAPLAGVTVSDMNKIVHNMLYLKKYGGRVNVLSTSATVEGTTLKLTSEDA